MTALIFYKPGTIIEMEVIPRSLQASHVWKWGRFYPWDVLAGAILGSARELLGALVDGYVQNGIG